VGHLPESLANLSLARPGLDRRAERRAQADLVKRLLADPTTQVLVLHGDQVQVQATDEGQALVLRAPRADDDDGLAFFLGEDATGAAYLAIAGPPPQEGDLPHRRTLRQIGADLGDRDAGLFTTALALANWHRTHGFCPRCGAPTEPVQAGWLRRCTEDGTEHYPRTDPAVIMSVVDDAGRLLMARGTGWGEGRFSVLAGFVEPGESLAAAVAREVSEEVGIEVADVRYLGDQPWPFPTSLMVGFTARARSTELVLQDAEIAEARWFTRDEVREHVAAGSLGVSPRLSIARRLVEHWLGHEIDGVR
jgi:NAD+ diphosphatase